MKSGIKAALPVILLILFNPEAAGQEPVSPPTSSTVNNLPLEEQIEDLTGRNDTEADYSDIADEIYQYQKHPININLASESELSMLQLNDLQISNLRNYIIRYGELASLYELILIDGFDSLLAERLSPGISFKLNTDLHSAGLKNLIHLGKNQLIVRYQQTPEMQQGYRPIDDSAYRVNPESRYMGGPQKLLLRYGYNFYNKIRFGATMEKDAGETFFHGPDSMKKGFDFYSFFFFYSGKKILRQLSVGDYQVQFGQGLTMQSSMAFGKSSNVIPNRRIAQQIIPSTGANENRFMRGIAATISPFRSTDVSLFFSSKRSDASINQADSLSAEENFITTLQETGYHRTPGELAGKDAVKQTVYGGNIQSRFRMFRIGVTALHTALDYDLQKKVASYSKFGFNGKYLDNFGVDYALILRGLTFYGEISGSSNGGKAMLGGLTLTPDPRLAMSMIYRNFTRDYQNFFSNAFAEGTGNANETGLYAGMQTQLHKKLSLTAYADHFRFPWLKYRVDAPSKGREYLIQCTWSPSRKTQMQFRYRYRQTQINTSGPEGYTEYPESVTNQNIRIHLIFKAMESLTLKSRIETILWKKASEGCRNGFLAYQDLVFSPPAKPWQLNARYALFDTDSYDQRLYAYESDVLYAFTVPAYYDKGSRFYLMGKYSAGRNLEIWARYSVTFFAHRQSIGSGPEEIDGNRKSEIKIQLRLQF